MKTVIQRTKYAKCIVNNEVVGEIDKGFMLLVGFTNEDDISDLEYSVKKISKLRIFDDEQGKINLDIKSVNGKILSISQFTLYADTKKGNRPSFVNAAKPEYATELYNKFNELLRNEGITVETGVFGEHMEIDFVNDGPVTIVIDSKNR